VESVLANPERDTSATLPMFTILAVRFCLSRNAGQNFTSVQKPLSLTFAQGQNEWPKPIVIEQRTGLGKSATTPRQLNLFESSIELSQVSKHAGTIARFVR